MKRPTRRGILIGTAAVIATGAGASAFACRPGATERAALNIGRLQTLLTEIQASNRIGPAYRRNTDIQTLLAEFDAHLGLQEVARHDCPQAARTELRAQATDDFRRGDIVVVDRLVMARSECILAALAT